MPYRFILYSGKDSKTPVIDMLIQSPNLSHAQFITRNLHMEFFANDYIPGEGMQNSRSSLRHE